MRLKILFWILVMCAHLPLRAEELKYKNPQTKGDVNHLLENMSIEDKVGQIFMFGFGNTNPSKELRTFIRKTRPGFIVLFKKNIVSPIQTSKLIYDLQEVSFSNNNTQIGFAVDQEGGDVVRIPTDPPLPTAMAMGRASNSEAIFQIGQDVGTLLSVLGIKINLAPVLDLAPPESSSFIQSRSFGADPNSVARFADQFSSGLNSTGVASTAKHFPGLGNTKQDSHKTSVVAGFEKKDIATFLKPYRDLVKKDSIQAVMLTHLIYPALDNSSLPATFSEKIISILRDLPFEGLIMTDDVEMAGAKVFSSPEKRAIEAFRSGSDVIMVAWNRNSQERAYKGLLSAVKAGDISTRRLDESVLRILRFKKRFDLLDRPTKNNKKEILATIKNISIKAPINTIFNKILSEELPKLRVSKKEIDVSRIAIVSNHYDYFNDFKKAFPSRSKFFPPHGSQTDKIQEYKPSLVLYFVSGSKAAKALTLLPKKLKERTIVINSIYPGSVESELYLNTLEIGMKHPFIGSAVGRALAEIDNVRLPSGDFVSSKNP